MILEKEKDVAAPINQGDDMIHILNKLLKMYFICNI
jgi:hypothetical protein